MSGGQLFDRVTADLGAIPNYPIVLCTLNARYWHSAFGLRYLYANMAELQEQTKVLEFGIKGHTIDLLGQILALKPKIVGFGVYIWNVEPITKLVSELKRVAPETTVIVGGPEVSYEIEDQAIAELADIVIGGEADLVFPQVCKQVLAGTPPKETFLPAPVPQFQDIALPYEFYTNEDIANRVIYVEVSRGCPYTCEFCLSALEIPVRLADVDEFLLAMDNLLSRGAKQFKFVDRTFNLNMRVSTAILEFFLQRYQEGLFLHFELIPDRLPEHLRELIAKFPAGSLQFEIGVQTFNEDVGERISRTQNNAKLEENFQFLRQKTGVHIHADLIVGLPGETIESFAQGFDRLVWLDPQEIQVGILKRLRGTPICRHDETFEMVYSPHPPYEILSTSVLSFFEVQRLRRFARYWDLVANSGNFTSTRTWLLADAPFEKFMAFCDWLYAVERKLHGISLVKLSERLFQYLVQEQEHPEPPIAEAIWTDYVRGGRVDKPKFLQKFDLPAAHRTSRKQIPPRQAKHTT